MDVKHVNYIKNSDRGMGIIAFYAGTENALAPGHVSGPIIRDCFILQYVREGSGVVQINGNAFEVTEGECYATFPGAVTTMIADEKYPWAKSWICLRGDRVRHFLDLFGVNEECPVFPWKHQKEVLNYIQYAIEALKPHGDMDELNQNICGNELFKLLMELSDGSEAKITLEQKQSTYIVRALRFIEHNFSRSITVCDIAEHVGLNRTYFSSLFKEKTGATPHQYLIDYKIKKACEFLKNPNASVASVGASVGYEPQVFSRLFKAQTGLTPKEYIKK